MEPPELTREEIVAAALRLAETHGQDEALAAFADIAEGLGEINEWRLRISPPATGDLDEDKWDRLTKARIIERNGWGRIHQTIQQIKNLD